MSGQDIKSRPVYTPLARDPAGRAHLLIIDDAAPPAEAFAPGTSAADFPETWSVAAHSQALPAPLAGNGAQAFRSASHLIAMLRHRLARETMGLRLYAIGAEHFCWDVAACASAAGMGRDEFFLYAAGKPARRVVCVHCRTLNEGVSTNLITCTGCHARLFVRDHFSRLGNAFMGVQIDAEVPGETIEIEELSA
ncbi:dimethylamine monooxygenase subunit DmmA family protein [Novosphingobium sp. Chol11]|uniref:dimethylamine monooxygenase subunit DmmA family protein n=1 Tax=Novosphingobium sp. Chol11 TaxID=1385763 RepID=UPI0025EC61A4|nr:dimethylamine monooxygenase subunit DmmA family protein [Novosphingobium sp. Chol11]